MVDSLILDQILIFSLSCPLALGQLGHQPIEIELVDQEWVYALFQVIVLIDIDLNPISVQALV